MNSYSLLQTVNKSKYEKIVTDAMTEFELFFGLTLMDKPCLIFLNSRQQFNDICGHDTLGWVTGYSLINVIFLLDEASYATESTRKFDQNIYDCQIKHEVCHCYYRQLAWNKRPVWLNEGVSIFLSGQLKFHRPVEAFNNFLNFYQDEQVEISGTSVYQESGFVIEKLVNKFGREKLLSLIKSCHDTKNNDDFLKSFNQIYGFELNYESINQL